MPATIGPATAISQYIYTCPPDLLAQSPDDNGYGYAVITYE